MTDQTVRDGMAMAALTGILANPGICPFLKAHTQSNVEHAYRYADAMMEARALSPRKGGDNG